MNNLENPPTIAALFVVKNEWPLFAMTLSHALTRYANKVIIIDTGSSDGIFSGVKMLQEIWPDRIQMFRCDQEVFDQAPLANLLLEMAKLDGLDWSVLLDADEILSIPSPDALSKFLKELDTHYSALSIPVDNFIVDQTHDDQNLEDFLKISYRIEGENVFGNPDENYAVEVKNGLKPVQNRRTANKILCKNSGDIFVSLGNHQVVFGDGIFWEKHDSRVASSSKVGLKILHLPHTSKTRLKNRLDRTFFDKAKTFSRLNIDTFGGFDFQAFHRSSTLNADNKKNWLQKGVIIEDLAIAKEFEAVANELRSKWDLISNTVFSEDDRDSFTQEIDLKVVSSALRKYHSKSEKLWPGQR